MHLKYWIETCLKQKKWTIQKLKEEIDKIKQETEHKEHAKKLEKIEDISNDSKLLRQVAKHGAIKARESASKTIKEVREIIGFKSF